MRQQHIPPEHLTEQDSLFYIREDSSWLKLHPPTTLICMCWIQTETVLFLVKAQENLNAPVIPVSVSCPLALLAQTCPPSIHLARSSTVEPYLIPFLRTQPALECHQAVQG